MVTAQIYIEPDEVKDLFEDNKDDLYLYELIAESPELGMEISLSNEDGQPCITVCDDDDVLYTEIVDLNECESVVNDVYDRFLDQNYLINRYCDGTKSTTEQEELIDDREIEIDEAFEQMIDTIVPNIDTICNDVASVLEDIKELVCERLYKKHNISMYRPMYLEEEDGALFFTKYPYPEME